MTTRPTSILHESGHQSLKKSKKKKKKKSTTVKKYACGEVCLAVYTTSSLVGDSTLQQFADDSYNLLKDITGKSFKLLEYNTGSESKLADKKGFEIDFQEKQGKRGYIQKLMGVLYPDPDAYESKTLFKIQSGDKDTKII